ncbi:MAG: hypothetical protein AB7N76_10275 [Planctomycetota bacterium]
MSPRRSLLALLAALALLLGLLPGPLSGVASAAPVPVPSPSPTPTGKWRYLAEVYVGFDNGCLGNAPSPLWVTLTNDQATEQRFTLVARSRRARSSREVAIPAGGRRRVALALRVNYQLSVEIRQGEQLIESREFQDVLSLEPARHLLVIDGRAADARKGGGTRRDDPSLQVTVIPPELASVEAACYSPFGAVFLRALDPGVLTRDQLDALLEYVLQGGTVLLSGAGPDRQRLLQFLSFIPGADRKPKLLSRTALERLHGLGRVLAFSDDLLADALGSADIAPRLRQELGDLVAANAGSARIAPTCEEFGGALDEHPGFRTIALVGGFFALYFLVVGPGLGIGLRKANRRRLAAFAVGAIALFSLVALLLAGTVRTAAGTAFVRETVLVPLEGTPVGLTDVTVVSAGAWRHGLELTSAPDHPFAATLSSSDQRRHHRGSWTGVDAQQATSVETWRGHQVSLDVRLSPWDQRSVHVTQARPELRPIAAELKPASGPAAAVARGRRAFEVTIKNTTSLPFGPAIVVEEGRDLDRAAGYWQVPVLQPGEETTVVVWTDARNQAALRRDYSGPTWATPLGIPESWRAWTRVRGSGRAGRSDADLALGFLVVSRVEPGVRAAGGRLNTVGHALRLDPIKVAGTLERGYVGIVPGDGSKLDYGQGPITEVRVNRVLTGGPAAQVGVQVGDVIQQILPPGRDPVNLTSSEHFLAEMARFQPGQVVGLSVRMASGGYRQVQVRLVRREQIPGQ